MCGGESGAIVTFVTRVTFAGATLLAALGGALVCGPGSQASTSGGVHAGVECPWNPNARGSDPRVQGILERPQWSKDGRSIAFTSGIVLWRIGIDGKRLRLLTTMVGDANLSHDWTRIVFSGRGATPDTGGLCTARIDGTGRRPLTERLDLSPKWSPDGRRLAVARAPTTAEGGTYGELWTHVLDAAGRPLSQITGRRTPYPPDHPDEAYPRSYDLELAWSPDGRRLAITGQYCQTSIDCDPYVYPTTWRLFVVDVESGARHDITPPAVRAPQDPAWTTDGRHVVFSAPPAIPPSARPGTPLDNVAHIYVVDADGGGLHRLRTTATGASPCHPKGSLGLDGDGEHDPAYSPDGKWVAFNCTNFEKSRSNLYVVRAAGGIARPLVPSR